ncbi:MAG: WecB/TagA/CpsF family glycosyltransferase, partial [bacterium]
MDRVNILGVNVDVINQPELLSEIDRLAAAQHPVLVNNVNVHACNIAYADREFRDILNASEIVFCDGYGVKLAARLLGKILGQRMTPPDWIDDLFRLCVQRRYNLYFLGDTDEVVQRFARRVKEKHPGIRVVGQHDGYFALDSEVAIRLLAEIRQAGPDIVLTGMGMPLQEKWAWRARPGMGKGVIIATGALFRWYTGYERRAPRWMTQHGLEWLARLAVMPRRHFKRYVIGLPLFFARVLGSKLRRKVRL